MPDRAFSEPVLAELYDVLNSSRTDYDFYLDVVLAAPRVLDVGCGTGELLISARKAGHQGQLSGLDPAAAMLVQARRRAPDIEWLLGDLRTHRWQRAFDAVVMTGHAFQVLLGDDELRSALTTVRSALADDGRFVFETRNPAARAWERWTPEHVREVRYGDGESATVRVWDEVELPLRGDRVTFTETFETAAWPRPRTSRSTLRFLTPEALSGFLTEAGLRIETQYGDWDRSPLTETSPEIITVAVRADA
ncbi:hypothetical protein OK074_0961 [Actinobacteria bacterium OK074]|nr:hypothetical protein OK074_0961 [Actinobacteria bacterium OK074]